jgi:hypothetical protein
MTKFVSKVPGSAKLGQRHRITDPMCRLAVMDVRALCAVIGLFGSEHGFVAELGAGVLIKE